MKAQAGTIRLLALHAAVFDLIELTVLHKAPTCRTEDESDIMGRAFIMKHLDPLVMAGPRAAVVFPVADSDR